MANPSPDKDAVEIALTAVERRFGNMWEDASSEWGNACGGPDAHEIYAQKILSAVRDELERATPPSPSTAPEGTVTDYGTPVDERATFEAWFVANRFGGLKESMWAAWEARALASRPAEVDDEGLPPLPPEAARAMKGAGTFFVKWQDAGKDLRGALMLYTAEQFRQGQRDAREYQRKVDEKIIARRDAALSKIIEMNRQHAEDQYGDANKAESWACIRVAREAMAGSINSDAVAADRARRAEVPTETCSLCKGIGETKMRAVGSVWRHTCARCNGSGKAPSHATNKEKSDE